MSLSPFKSGVSNSSRDSRLSNRSTAPEGDRLSVSQALLITAGLAGLVGLCSGVFIRFSFANSPNARFLSPLQTFPDIPTWTPELPQGTADSHYLPGGGSLERDDGLRSPTQVPTFDSDDAFSDSISTGNEDIRSRDQDPEDAFPMEFSAAAGLDPADRDDPLDIGTFDSFAGRDNGSRRPVDPWENLEKGPATLGHQRDDIQNAENYPAVEELSPDEDTYYEYEEPW